MSFNVINSCNIEINHLRNRIMFYQNTLHESYINNINNINNIKNHDVENVIGKLNKKIKFLLKRVLIEVDRINRANCVNYEFSNDVD